MGKQKNYRLIAPSDCTIMPWKNGQGQTTEIDCVSPSDNATAPYLWRLSIADIAVSGPFSTFDGYDRISLPIAGDGIRLTLDGQSHVIRSFDSPLRYPGDTETGCELLGSPIRNFNLIHHRARTCGEMTVLRQGQTLPLRPDDGRVFYIHAIGDPVGTACGNWKVPAGSTLRVTGFADPIDLVCGAGSLAIVVTVSAVLPTTEQPSLT